MDSSRNEECNSPLALERNRKLYIIEIIGGAQAPFQIFPLDKRESRWLWASLRFADRIDKLIFKVDIPPNWLTDKMNAKVLSKKV